MSYTELLIGAGSVHRKRLIPNGKEDWENLTTLDINADHRPDVVWDLEKLPLPFDDNQFDEIHAYEVLEHTGYQGDYKFFFAQFAEFWRILKPGGFLCGTSPSRQSSWAWGDPSHKRVIQAENFVFLDQEQYTKQIGNTPMTDFRYIYQADLAARLLNDDGGTIYYIVQAIKPSRISIPVGLPRNG